MAVLAPGTRFGGYLIDSVIARGGMGVVYRARHERLRRMVALKVIAPDLAADDKFRRRFVRESELAAAVEHPHIVPIYDAGEVGGQLFLSMRLIPGDLRTRLREGPLAPDSTLSVVEQVGGALDAAHAVGLVHRDVKASNILLEPAVDGPGPGICYLADFGLGTRVDGRSLSSQTGEIVGTIDYLAPEQIEGGELDGRTDIYGLACMAYECLAGTVPYQADSPVQLLYAKLNDPVPAIDQVRPGIPPETSHVLARGMARRREERYPKATEFAAALRQALGVAGRPETASAPPAPRRPGSRRPATRTGWSRGSGRKRRRTTIAFAVSAVLVGAVGLAGFLAARDGGGDPSGGQPGQVGAPIVCGGMTRFQICRSDAEGGGLIGLTDGRHNAFNTAWSPDGERIAYVSDEDGDTEIWVMARDGSGREQLTHNRAQDAGPSWSKGGSIVFVSEAGGHADLWTMDGSGEGLHQLTASPEKEGAPTWSPDGESIAYTVTLSGIQRIFTIAPEDGAVPSMVVEGANAAWAPNGLLSFTRETNAGSEIFVVPVDGTRQPTRLTGNRECDGFQSWSPDGDQLVFSSTRAGDDYDIFALEYPSGAVRQLVDTPTNDYRPVWSQLGQIVFETTAQTPADCTK